MLADGRGYLGMRTTVALFARFSGTQTPEPTQATPCLIALDDGPSSGFCPPLVLRTGLGSHILLDR